MFVDRDKGPKLLTNFWFCCCSCALLSWPYRVWFEGITSKTTYKFVKEISVSGSPGQNVITPTPSDEITIVQSEEHTIPVVAPVVTSPSRYSEEQMLARKNHTIVLLVLLTVSLVLGIIALVTPWWVVSQGNHCAYGSQIPHPTNTRYFYVYSQLVLYATCPTFLIQCRASWNAETIIALLLVAGLAMAFLSLVALFFLIISKYKVVIKFNRDIAAGIRISSKKMLMFFYIFVLLTFHGMSAYAIFFFVAAWVSSFGIVLENGELLQIFQSMTPTYGKIEHKFHSYRMGTLLIGWNRWYYYI